MLLVFSLTSGFPGVVQVSFNGIQAIASTFWPETTPLHIQMLSSSSQFLSFPVSLLAAALLQRTNLRTSVTLAAVVAAAGCWARWGLRAHFWPFFAAQLVVSASQNVASIGSTTFAMLWFPPDQRAIATTGASLGGLVCLIIGFLVSGVSVHSKRDIPPFLFYQAVTASSLLVLVLVLFRFEPPDAPRGKIKAFEVGLKEGGADPPEAGRFVAVRGLATASMIAPVLAYSSAIGCTGTVSTTIGLVVSPYFSKVLDPEAKVREVSALASFLAASGCAAGVAFALSVSFVYGRGRVRSSLLLPVCLVLAAAALSWFNLSIRSHSPAVLLYLSNAAFVGFAVSAIPIAFEAAAEASHPAPPSSSAALLSISGNVVVLSLIPIVDATKRDGSVMRGVWVLAGTLAVAGVMSAVLPERRRRSEAEAREKREREPLLVGNTSVNA